MVSLKLNNAAYKEAGRLASLLGMNSSKDICRMAMMIGLAEIRKRFESELSANPPNSEVSEPAK